MGEKIDDVGMDFPKRNIEIIVNDKSQSICDQLMSQLEEFKNLSLTTSESKKSTWLKFISVWCEILEIVPSEIKECYIESARLLPILIKSTDFYTTRKEINIARENCFSCIKQLNQSHIKSYLLLDKNEQELSENQIYYKHIYYLLLIASQTASFLPFATINDQKFIDNYLELFILLIERVDKKMSEHCINIIENNYILGTINDRILSFFWNLTDRTVLIPILLKCDLAKRVINWICQSSMLTEKSRRPFISIIHNIARHDDGADQLNKYDAIKAIKQYQQIRLEKNDSRIVIISMALALLSTPSQLKNDKKGMNIVLNKLLQLTIDSSKGYRYRSDGIHVSEPLGVLVKMFVVEERTLDYILCHAETEPSSDIISTIKLFISLFFIFSDALKTTDRLEQFTLIAILNILWSISFQFNYKQELINQLKFIKKIQIFIQENNQQEILEQYKPRSMEGIQQAIHGILINLNIDENKLNQYNQFKYIQSNNKPWIMISYSHDNNTFCDEIFNLLNTYNENFNIWIDRTHCQGAIDLWESIAHGMEKSSIILCLLSNQYFQSKSCRQEFIYAADSLKRRIIPLLIQDFEPKGWLGIRMTGMKYIRFKNINQLDKNKINELLNTILSTLSPSKSTPTDSTSTVINSPVLPIDQQTSIDNDIQKWFSQYRISKQFRDLFDFQTIDEMLDYAQLLIKDREKQMNIYGRIFSQKYNGNDMPPHEFNRFSIALEKLLNEKRPSSSISVKTNSSTPIKSKTCVIS